MPTVNSAGTLAQPPQALPGLKILDASRLLPAALCTQMLADLGAQVLKVEEPGRGDYQRSFPPMGKADSGTFLLCNRNKQSITLNLKSEEGKAVFRKLAADADVVVEGFRPGVMKRLGLDYESLKEINPRLIYCAVSGFGQDGPYKMVAGHDLNYMGIIGALPLFGQAGGPPMVPGLLTADLWAGTWDRIEIGRDIGVGIFLGITNSIQHNWGEIIGNNQRIRRDGVFQ